MNNDRVTPTRSAHGIRISRFTSLCARAVATAALFAGDPDPARAQAAPWVGLSSFGSQLRRETDELVHGPAAGDHFGFAVAAGDFDGDGRDDLATGLLGNNCLVGGAPVADCGSVVIHWSRPGGIGNLFARIDPTDPASPIDPPALYLFGSALATGDFDHDGQDDLAIGIPGSSAAGMAGAVQVHYGESGGIDVDFLHYLKEGSAGLPGDAAHSRLFGWAFAVGDFDGGGHADLAIGAPELDFTDTNDGAVFLLYGSLFADGFEGLSTEIWSSAVP